MSSTFSPNRLYNLQATGDNNGTWGVVANSDFSIIDLNFGGRLPIDVSGNTDVTVNTTQARNVYHEITGALTGSINYILPAEGMTYILNNGTSGAFTLTAKITGGTGIIVPQGTTMAVFVNPDTPALTKAFNYCTNVFSSTSATGGTGNAQTITVDSNFTLAVGNTIICKLGNSNSGAMTLAVNGGSAKNVTDVKGNALASGAAASGQIAIFSYDGTEFLLLNPAILPVAVGGTGASSLTAYAVVCGGTTSTGAIQSIASVGTSGQVLTSNGAGALPTFQDIAVAVGASLFPVGSIYTNYSNATNPATLLGFGTWTALQDSFLIGAGGTYAAGSTGGATTHTLTAAEIPALNYTISFFGSSSGSTPTAYIGNVTPALSTNGTATGAITTNAGGGSHSILNPYVAVYMWRRTA